jgi:hypothetical protein
MIMRSRIAFAVLLEGQQIVTCKPPEMGSVFLAMLSCGSVSRKDGEDENAHTLRSSCLNAGPCGGGNFEFHM